MSENDLKQMIADMYRHNWRYERVITSSGSKAWKWVNDAGEKQFSMSGMLNAWLKYGEDSAKIPF